MPLDNITELRKRVPGGKYTLARAIAERARQLQSGATPLTEVRTPNPLSVAIDEIVQGKVSFNIDKSTAPAGADPDNSDPATQTDAPAGTAPAATDLLTDDTLAPEG